MLQSRAAQGPGNLGIGKAPQFFKELNLDKNDTSYYKDVQNDVRDMGFKSPIIFIATSIYVFYIIKFVVILAFSNIV